MVLAHVCVSNLTRKELRTYYDVNMSSTGNGGGELLTGLWYVGVIMSIVASISSNLGVNVQKFSMMKEHEKMPKK